MVTAFELCTLEYIRGSLNHEILTDEEHSDVKGVRDRLAKRLAKNAEKGRNIETSWANMREAEIRGNAPAVSFSNWDIEKIATLKLVRYLYYDLGVCTGDYAALTQNIKELASDHRQGLEKAAKKLESVGAIVHLPDTHEYDWYSAQDAIAEMASHHYGEPIFKDG